MASSGEFMRDVELPAGFFEIGKPVEITEVRKVVDTRLLGVHSTSVYSKILGRAEKTVKGLTKKLPMPGFARSFNPGRAHSSSNCFMICSPSQRSAASRVHAQTDGRADGRDRNLCNSECSNRTREDEQCFETIMWSLKEISTDFECASYSDQIDHQSQLSQCWFQHDAQHYDEKQKKLEASNMSTKNGAGATKNAWTCPKTSVSIGNPVCNNTHGGDVPKKSSRQWPPRICSSVAIAAGAQTRRDFSKARAKRGAKDQARSESWRYFQCSGRELDQKTTVRPPPRPPVVCA